MIGLADSAAHVLVGNVSDPVLSEADHHHLARVLRVRAGERVTVTDGHGAWQWCEWTGTGLRVVGDGGVRVLPEPAIGVAVSLIKGDRLDWVVQKLTEVGVDRIQPLVAEHSVVRWTADKARAQVERLRRIAHEASMQSRRVHLPVVDEPVSAAQFLALPGVVRADLGAASWSTALAITLGGAPSATAVRHRA